MYYNQTETITIEEIAIDETTGNDSENKIVVFNDDVNSFDHVIATFQRVLKHTYQQAEQCAMIIHYKGKCTVKEGDIEELLPINQALLDAKLSSQIM